MTGIDLILVGGGLANTLIALRLDETRPELNILLIERAESLGGNHTWSFHGSDLTPEQHRWIKPLVQYSWDDYEVRFPGRNRTLPGTYHSITSERLDATARDRLRERVRSGTSVARLQPDQIVLESGEILRAGAVIDGRGPGPSPQLDVRFQKFVGQVVELAAPHDLRRPIIMDATKAQEDGYRFFYILPFDERTLLIEDTRYSDSPGISLAEYGHAISDYAADQGWQIGRVLRQEEGVLPITLGGDIDAFWNSATPVARAGLRAALYHPATGYSLPNAVRLADQLAQLTDWTAETVYRQTRAASESLWDSTGFYRVLNRMLFLAAEPMERRTVLQRFYGLNSGLIGRFYAGRNTRLDKLRILAGKPPVGLRRAFNAVFRYSPPR